MWSGSIDQCFGMIIDLALTFSFQKQKTLKKIIPISERETWIFLLLNFEINFSGQYHTQYP